VARKETTNGAKVTEKQIATWANEGGALVGAVQVRRRGRPGRGAEASQIVAVRLTADEIAALDERAKRAGKSRSEVIRGALNF
jgi:Ribbon-helix-helix protein, copG family